MEAAFEWAFILIVITGLIMWGLTSTFRPIPHGEPGAEISRHDR